MQEVIDGKRSAIGEPRRQTPRDSFPVIHATKPGDENQPGDKVQTPQEPKLDATAQAPPKPQQEDIKEPTAPTGEPAAPKPALTAEPRRFHLFRVPFAPSPLFNASSATGKRARFNNVPTTVFVERGHKRTKTEDVTMTDADTAPATVTKDITEEPDPSMLRRKQKLPGSDRKAPSVASGKPVPVKKYVPDPMKTEQSEEMDELAREMNEFVLQQIGANLAMMEERDRKEATVVAKRTPSVTSPQSSKFKPKAPAKRYAERHPEVATTPEKAAPAAPADIMDYESHSEDEYVVETYVRVPATTLDESVNPEKIGLLVFDNEPDVDYFYGEEGDSEDEWPEDDEDSNGEPPTGNPCKNRLMCHC